jgi:hypothetical protein
LVCSLGGLLVGVLLAIIVPCIGIIVVLKRLSMIGDALSHTSLAGVAAGLVMGINPIVGALAACVAAALGIEAIRKRIPRYSELSIAIIMSAGIGLAGVLSGFVKSSANFNSFLFGSIVAISDFELWMVVGISVAVMAAFLMFYRELFFIALDERAARLAGVPVGAVNFAFTIPEEGGVIWTDNMCIPAHAENPVGAMQLADWYYDPKIAALLTEYNNSVGPVPAAKAIIEQDAAAASGEDRKILEAVATSPFVFPTPEIAANVHRYRVLTSDEFQQWNDLFGPIYAS